MKNIFFVFGGKSYEHDISIISAAQVVNRFNDKNFKLVPLYISKDDRFFVYQKNRLDINDFKNFSGKNRRFKEVFFVTGENRRLFSKTFWGLKEYLQSDVAIICCHGRNGENGKLVSFFENFSIKCSSGSFDALAICMNKFLFKQAMIGLKIPTVKGFLMKKEIFEKNRNFYEDDFRKIRFPVILKINSGGSSIGVFVAKNKKELDGKLEEAFSFGDDVLVEKYIKGIREFNIAVVGTSSSFVLSRIDEVKNKSEIFSFEDKYISYSGNKNQKGKTGKLEKKDFALINENLKKEIENCASKIFLGLNLFGVVRIDFLYDEKKEKLYVCEANSVPGSLAYQFFDDCKITSNALVCKLIEIAEGQFDENQQFNENFVTSVLN